MKHKKISHYEKIAGAIPASNGDNQTGTDFALGPDEVARKAYFSYVNEGAPEGRAVQHWLDAEARLLKERNLTRTHGFAH
jgi:hypothetical protein